jgi:hypothetical protein
MSVSFGMHLESPTVVAAYHNGVVVGRYTHTAQSGPYIAMALAATNSPGPRPHVDRVEVRDGPGGTILFADDFSSLAGWTVGWSNDGPWTINPAGFAYIATSGETLYRAQPSGGVFIEAQGITFDGSVPDGWLMLILERTSPTNRPDTATLDGYRVLLRAPGAPNAGGVEIVNGTALVGGWGVGMVRMGSN